MKTMSLAGKAAIVTGARRGIGAAVARVFAEAGADVAACDSVLDDGGLNALSKDIAAMGKRSVALQVDISRKTEVELMAKRAVEAFGRIDILVNCAGIWLPGRTLLECDDESWERVIDTNLTGTFLCCRAIGKIMASQKSGTIINISSQVGLNPGVANGAYSVSKAGIIMLTRQLALELSGYNIRVNAIAPGVVMTDFNKYLWTNEETASQITESIPLRRMATPDDVAEPALFLASEASAYMTGTVINVDGGWRVPATPPKE